MKGQGGGVRTCGSALGPAVVVVMFADGCVAVAPLGRVPGPRVSVDIVPLPVSAFEGQSFAPQQ